MLETQRETKEKERKGDEEPATINWRKWALDHPDSPWIARFEQMEKDLGRRLDGTRGQPGVRMIHDERAPAMGAWAQLSAQALMGQIKLPKFSGDPREWATFEKEWEMYNRMMISMIPGAP